MLALTSQNYNGVSNRRWKSVVSMFNLCDIVKELTDVAEIGDFA